MTSPAQWLNENSGSVTAIAAVAGALITAVYAYFTVLLWRATRRQADITQRMLEASHRPYLTLEAKPPIDVERGPFSFEIVVTNQGNVPATITRWVFTVSTISSSNQILHQIEPIELPLNRSLSPRDVGLVQMHFGRHEVGSPTPSLRLAGLVEYTGLAPRFYRTQFDADLLQGSWTRQGYQME